VWDLNLLMLGDLVLELARLLRNQYPRQADPRSGGAYQEF